MFYYEIASDLKKGISKWILYTLALLCLKAAIPVSNLSGYFFETAIIVDIDFENSSEESEDDTDDLWSSFSRFFISSKQSKIFHHINELDVQSNGFFTITSPPPELG